MRKLGILAATVLVAGTVSARQNPLPPQIIQSATPLAPSILAATPAPAASAPVLESLRAFEPRDVKLTWHNRHWQLTHHGEVIKDFGQREQEARLALRVIQDLRLNQYGTVGSPTVMEYWLCDGVAPMSQARHGLRTLPLDVAKIKTEELKGDWCLRDGGRTLFSFGTKQADARQALAVMQKHHFDQVGMIGQPAPSMYVFLSRNPTQAPTLTKGPTTATGGHNTRSMESPRFSRLAKNKDGTPRTEGLTSSKSPVAGLPTPALPPISKPLPASTLALQPTLTSRQTPLWRDQGRLSPAAQPTPVQPERLTFDWRQAQIRQNGADWQLVSGAQVLANFGPNAHDARLALAAVRHYRFTEQRRVTTDGPTVSYWAATPQSPYGLMMGLQGEVLQPEQLEVQQVGTRFALCNGSKVLMEVSDRRDDATKLLEVIKTNQYDRLCQLGDPSKEGMAVLVKSRKPGPPITGTVINPDQTGAARITTLGTIQPASFVQPKK